MRDAQCSACLKKFHKKDIYTIQQFQYRKEPPYQWSLSYFESIGISEWDSFCENCITKHKHDSETAWDKINTV